MALGLPAVSSSLVGREDAIKEVAWRLRASGLVTLVGPGGGGKTRLAVAVADALGAEGQPVVFVDLSASSGPGSVLGCVASALGVVAEPGEDLFEAVAAGIADDGLLLVLDSCERIRGGCAAVAEALGGACGGLLVLATSRQRLGARGEVVWPVPPLSLPPEPVALAEAVLDSEAVQLFCERATALQRGFLPAADNVGAIVEICRRLEGNPLAIELAAARIVALPPPDIAARLDDRFGLLQGGPSTAPARHRSLRAALAWSYEMLSQPERALLRRLSVFTARFGLGAAEQVCGGGDVEPGQVLESLTSLVDKSLVVNESTASVARFRLVDTVRVYAAERLEEAGTTAALAERHTAWCVALVEEEPRSRAGRDWVERLDVEQDSLAATLDRALSEGRAELALRMVCGQMSWWERRGLFGQARERLERVLAATIAAPEHLHASAQHHAGRAALMLGDLDAARRHLRASLTLSAERPDRTALARTRTLLRFAATFDDDPATVDDLEHTAAEVRATGNDAELAEVLAACGQARMDRGDPGAARRHFEASLQAGRRADCNPAQTTSLVGLGSAELQQGDYPAAEGHLHESITLLVAAGDTHGEVLAFTWLAELDRLHGDHDGSRNRFEECLHRARAMTAPHPLTRSLLGVAQAMLNDGDPAGAQPRFDEAAVVAQRAGLTLVAVAALVGSARAASALGDLASGGARLDQASALAHRRHDRAGEALTLDGWAHLSQVEGNVTRACLHQRHALALQADVGDPAAVTASIEALGTLAAAQHEFSVAARLLGAADSLRCRYGCGRAPSADKERTEAVESVRETLGDWSFDIEWRRGQAMSTHDAMAAAKHLQGRRVPRSSSGWESLTGAERKVAALAAQGRTNTQIALEVGIAPSTVKAHLRRVFVKLGVANRAALAAAAHRLPER